MNPEAAKNLLDHLAQMNLVWHIAGKSDEFVEYVFAEPRCIMRLREAPYDDARFELFLYTLPKPPRDDRYVLHGYAYIDKFDDHWHSALRIWNDEPTHATELSKFYERVIADLDALRRVPEAV